MKLKLFLPFIFTCLFLVGCKSDEDFNYFKMGEYTKTIVDQLKEKGLSEEDMKDYINSDFSEVVEKPELRSSIELAQNYVVAQTDLSMKEFLTQLDPDLLWLAYTYETVVQTAGKDVKLYGIESNDTVVYVRNDRFNYMDGQNEHTYFKSTPIFFTLLINKQGEVRFHQPKQYPAQTEEAYVQLYNEWKNPTGSTFEFPSYLYNLTH